MSTSRAGQGLPRKTLRAFHRDLREWYAANRRDLPWRRRAHDPYAVWVAEAMLQQTQVAAATPYYERWMRRFPTLRALAEAPQQEALRVWAGLGYYARARNLHRAAEEVMSRHGGSVPRDPEAVQALPGIGRYTAGAILSIAYGLPVPVVDANVARVLARVFAVEGDPRARAARERLWALAAALVPRRAAGDHNQALMELGALVCTPSDPACPHCPLLSVCIAGGSPDPTAWPHRAPGRPVERVTHACAALRSGDRWLVTLRPPHGLWGGLWEFPRRVCSPGERPRECAARAAAEVAGVTARLGNALPAVRHAVTHHAITLHAYVGEAVSAEPRPVDCAEVRWVTVAELEALPRPAPQTRLALPAWPLAGDPPPGTRGGGSGG